MPSTVVASIQYNAGESVLKVIFVSGKVYEYQAVPESVYSDMKLARSKGTFLNTHIKGHYDFRQVS